VELNLGGVSIRIPCEPSDPSPFEIQNSKIVHGPPLLVHTSAKNFNALRVIELPFQVRGYRAGKSFKIGYIHILDPLIPSEAANGLPSDRP
jgi:hypothetical protein